MEIRRRASRRSGAEQLTVAADALPRLEWDAESGRLLLHAEDSVSPRDEGSRYDYVVALAEADIELIRSFLARTRGAG